LGAKILRIINDIRICIPCLVFYNIINTNASSDGDNDSSN
jgi:hypothetical protein